VRCRARAVLNIALACNVQNEASLIWAGADAAPIRSMVLHIEGGMEQLVVTQDNGVFSWRTNVGGSSVGMSGGVLIHCCVARVGGFKLKRPPAMRRVKLVQSWPRCGRFVRALYGGSPSLSRKRQSRTTLVPAERAERVVVAAISMLHARGYTRTSACVRSTGWDLLRGRPVPDNLAACDATESRGQVGGAAAHSGSPGSNLIRGERR
jgi:hypothetical protein